MQTRQRHTSLAAGRWLHTRQGRPWLALTPLGLHLGLLPVHQPAAGVMRSESEKVCKLMESSEARP